MNSSNSATRRTSTLPEHRPGRGSRRRAGVGIVDQLLYSFGNFALTVVVARDMLSVRNMLAARFPNLNLQTSSGQGSLLVEAYLTPCRVYRANVVPTRAQRLRHSDPGGQ